MTVRRANAADTRNLCTTAMRAFHDDPVMRWLYPDDDVYFQPDGAVFAGAMRDWLAQQEPWCTDDGAAVAVWFPPVDSDASPSAAESAAEHAPNDDSPPLPPELVQRFELIGPVMAENKPDGPYWYLQLLATHPDWQRQGLGATLMQVVFDQADPAGLPCYLETERPELVAYYRRYGFEVRSEWDVDPDAVLGEAGPHMWGMLRPPR